MRATLIFAVAAATVLPGLLGDRVEAMPQPVPSAFGGATHQRLVQQAAVVCGNNGCAPVQTSRVKRRVTHP